MGLYGLGALIPASFMAAGQLASLAPWWVALFGGGIVVTSVAMVIWSWLGRSAKGLAGAYVVLVSAGLLTWPSAWLSPEPAQTSPWLWMCMSVSTVCCAVVAGTRWGFVYAVVSSAVFAAVRLTPSGQGVPPLTAAQDMLVLVVNPAAVLVWLGLVTESVRRLEESLAVSRREQAQAAVEEALVEERRRLDGLVHDEVMTTLVAAARSTGAQDAHVAELAGRAISRLAEAEAPADTAAPVTAHHLARLVEDVVKSVCPDADVRAALTEPPLVVPQAVASALALAARELALNTARHAGAERVEVVVGDAPHARRGIQVQVSDDGRGFDPRRVPADRLGLQVSVTERVRAIGGRAEVRSQPGQGTVVTLTWLQPVSGPARAQSDAPKRPRTYPDLPTFRGPVLVRLVWMVLALELMVGWVGFAGMPPGWQLPVAQGVVVVAAALALHDEGVNPIPRARAWLVVVLLTVVGILSPSVFPEGDWPGYATWASSAVMLVLIVLLFRGREAIAWVGVVLLMVTLLAWATVHGLAMGDTVRAAFGPLAWMLLAKVLQRWLSEIAEQLAQSQRSSADANQQMARSFSQLVLRDIWLSQLREQVGPLLARLADPTVELTQAEREACLALEGRLRDDLRARNLISDAMSDAIEAARLRGVEVTLVDSRGSTLPEVVRRAAERHLDVTLAAPTTKRVVARAAPEGYSDVVTILTVRTDDTTELTSLDETGMVIASEGWVRQ